MDSSAWLEYLTNGPNASYFARGIERAEELLVPTVVLYEVFKQFLQKRGEDDAMEVVSSMQVGTVVSLDAAMALNAARLSSEFRLPMADSIILATARAYNATLWTQDSDFKQFDDVEYRERKP